MPGGKKRNPAASARQKLLNLARDRGEEFGLVLLRYALERFLYRLGCSPSGETFILKGAFLHVLWARELGESVVHRPTRDLDLLAFGSPTLSVVDQKIRQIAALEVEPADGLIYDPDSLTVASIRQDNRYAGARVRLLARLEQARIRLQIDVGFGDTVVPAPRQVVFPTLLGLEPPRIKTYSRETVVAEKLHAIVERGLANSRMKDYFDLDILARRFPFDGPLLKSAIDATFRRRATPVPERVPVGLSASFLEDPAKEIQWGAFLKKSRLEPVSSLRSLSEMLRGFLLPPLEALRNAEAFEQVWAPSGPWCARSAET